jgi:hypothetical protein
VSREEFIKVLDSKRYSYEIVGGKIIITHTYIGSGAMMSDLTSLPPGVEFKNREYVFLGALTSIPRDVEFNNKGAVILNALTSLPRGFEFNNKAAVYLESLTSLPPGVVFNNKGKVDLKSLTSISPGVEFKNGVNIWLDSLIGGYFTKWEGNIPGIAPNRLLNKMIKDGVFER